MRTSIAHRNARRGFTLIELVVTVAIIGLLATLAMPLMELQAKREKEQELRYALRHIRDGIDAYKLAYDQQKIAQIVGATGYPPNLDVLWQGVDDTSAVNSGKKIYFLRRLPRDPFSTDPSLTAAQTWGKRSYASSADEPSEGDDVYDVYSQSPDKDLRGIPYKEW
jgi:general secretion pathway protein G